MTEKIDYEKLIGKQIEYVYENGEVAHATIEMVDPNIGLSIKEDCGHYLVCLDLIGAKQDYSCEPLNWHKDAFVAITTILSTSNRLDWSSVIGPLYKKYGNNCEQRDGGPTVDMCVFT